MIGNINAHILEEDIQKKIKEMLKILTNLDKNIYVLTNISNHGESNGFSYIKDKYINLIKSDIKKYNSIYAYFNSKYNFFSSAYNSIEDKNTEMGKNILKLKKMCNDITIYISKNKALLENIDYNDNNKLTEINGAILGLQIMLYQQLKLRENELLNSYNIICNKLSYLLIDIQKQNEISKDSLNKYIDIINLFDSIDKSDIDQIKVENYRLVKDFLKTVIPSVEKQLKELFRNIVLNIIGNIGATLVTYELYEALNSNEFHKIINNKMLKPETIEDNTFNRLFKELEDITNFLKLNIEKQRKYLIPNNHKDEELAEALKQIEIQINVPYGTIDIPTQAKKNMTEVAHSEETNNDENSDDILKALSQHSTQAFLQGESADEILSVEIERMLDDGYRQARVRALQDNMREELNLSKKGRLNIKRARQLKTERKSIRQNHPLKKTMFGIIHIFKTNLRKLKVHKKHKLKTAKQRKGTKK